MKIDDLSTTLGVENDVESHFNVKIFFPANFANVIMPRRHAQNGVIDDLHSTLFISGFSQISPSNGKFGWNIIGEPIK